jgi:bifunctional non-homologous end joining protein LigD
LSSIPKDYTPQLPELVKSPPAGDEWVHELKYDGYRLGCRIARDGVSLLTRRGNDWSARFPAIVRAVRELSLDRVFLDGEAAIVLPDGRTSFQGLQNSLKGVTAGTLVYFVFDILYLRGRDLLPLPLSERKQILAQALGSHMDDGDSVIRYSGHVIGRGEEVFDGARQIGADGIVSKRRDLGYRPGRSREWLKIKCVQRQEFVIGGFTDPDGARVGIGALLVGVYEGERLTFAGKVGTGFTADTLTALRRRLAPLQRSENPFANRPPAAICR